MSLISISKGSFKDPYKSKRLYTYFTLFNVYNSTNICTHTHTYKHIHVKIPCKISACKLIIYSAHKPLTTIYSIHSHIIRYNITIYCML
nr:MAG TPA_asm: hypothetical protein [Caudoviricetes sp.]